MFFKRHPTCKRRTVSDSEKLPQNVDLDWFESLKANTSDRLEDDKTFAKETGKNTNIVDKVKIEHAKSCEHINAKA